MSGVEEQLNVSTESLKPMPQQECGCKGIRTCLICASSRTASFDQRLLSSNIQPVKQVGVVCYGCFHITSVSQEVLKKAANCRKCGGPLDPSTCAECDTPVLTLSATQLIDWLNAVELLRDQAALCRMLDSKSFGVHLCLNALSEAEECAVLQEIDEQPWALSQSGRRKQDYGVSVNFKKKKVKLGSFNGLPKFAFNTLMPKLKTLLASSQFRNATGCTPSSFEPVELCNLEYTPERGSAIDPHIDDSWLWGERLITFNLSGDTFLSLIPPPNAGLACHDFILKVPLPRRSVVILERCARHSWYHAIRREDIRERRIAVTLREMSEAFRKGSPEVADAVLNIARRCATAPSSSLCNQCIQRRHGSEGLAQIAVPSAP